MAQQTLQSVATSDFDCHTCSHSLCSENRNIYERDENMTLQDGKKDNHGDTLSYATLEVLHEYIYSTCF